LALIMGSHILNLDGQIIDIDRQLMEISRAECEESLAAFVRQAWHVIEPGQPYVHGWHIDFICEHLEAITRGDELDSGQLYSRLLINVPPGSMKSLLVGVFWPGWEWGPQNLPHHRFVCASHSLDLSIRDGLRMRRLVTSEWYQERWGDRVSLTGDQNQKTKFENTATGFRQAAASGSITGARGDRVVIDDPHSVDGANSDAMRDTTIQWFKEAVPTRLNNPDRSAIVVVMQRLHQRDVSGVILDDQLGYDHIMLPMEYDPTRATPTLLGLEDPRTEDCELLFPERFSAAVVERDKKVMGPYAAAGQFQQEPTPRGGGIIKPDWWETWVEEGWPPIDYVVASLDTAYTTKTENDYSALTIWGIFSGDINNRADNFVSARSKRKNVADEASRFDEGVRISQLLDHNPESVPRVMLMAAWQERLEMPDLVRKVIETCTKFKVDTLLVEAKASGISVSQELRRLYNNEDFGVHLINPGAIDKLSRLYSVQHLFSEGIVYAPDRHWSDLVIRQCEIFPKGTHDDLVDTVSMALRFMRDRGLLTRAPERMAEIDAGRRHTGKAPAPLYPI
jgi:predicted phage terminase large subunit-like protein